MALINCPECYKSVSDQSIACINCGFPISSKLSPFKSVPPPLPTSDFVNNKPKIIVKKSKPSKIPDIIAGLFIIFLIYQLATCSDDETQEPSPVQNTSSDSGFAQIPMLLSGSGEDGRYFLISRNRVNGLENIEYMRRGNENDAYGKMQLNCSTNQIRKTSSENPDSLRLADLGEWYTPTPDWTDKDIFNFVCE